ncbi:RNA 3'-terminal phosphate cyclase-like protein [Plakobranchus ocellatus]|uniref:RNA 3'-terminal phosphate cyclase-like protein n=1 Tax=Plakobranchus ocellatus TaxID=259542 RepID=A0AAV3ZBI0_9GAST|nr:RNA 3'-terminal phosphate cyclase-like protein [Plakobranchus ocellatus]
MRLLMSTLSGKSVKISQIRPEDDDPGLTDFEVSFIRLLDKVTNGTKTVITETGTQLVFRPGLLLGGSIEHDCHNSRPIGYYLEMLMCLAPFTKEPLRAVLRGVTSDKDDPSVDLLKLSVFPVLKRFLGTDEGLDLKVCKGLDHFTVMMVFRGSAEILGFGSEEKFPRFPRFRWLPRLQLNKRAMIRGVLRNENSTTIQFLRHIRDFFQVVFNIKVDKKPTSAARGDGTNEGEGEEEELKIGGDKLILTCVGVGYSNVSKAIR